MNLVVSNHVRKPCIIIHLGKKVILINNIKWGEYYKRAYIVKASIISGYLKSGLPHLIHKEWDI